MLTWKRLQSEQRAWSDFNFDPHTFLWPLWGTIEELGELVHARLKQEQGIRGTPEEHLANQKDAIGDGIVFLSDVCSQKGWDLGELAKTDGPDDFQKTYKAPAGKSPIRICLSALADLMVCLEDAERSEKQDDKDLFDAHARQAVHQYLIGLSGYCREKDWSLHEIVSETWGEVKKRNWRSNKATGTADTLPSPTLEERPDSKRPLFAGVDWGDSADQTVRGGVVEVVHRPKSKKGKKEEF